MATLHEITDAVADAFGFEAEDLRGPSRVRVVAHARFAAYSIARETRRFSLPKIGAFFGGRHHTGVMVGVERAKEMLAYEDFARDYNQAKETLGMAGAPVFRTTRKDRT